MHKTITVLAALLAAQLLLAAGISITEPDLAASRPDAPLIGVDLGAVGRIRIEGTDDEVVLQRKDDGWVLPGTGDFPADASNVERLLDSLGGLRRGFAVATSADARTRLRVAENDFERRLTLLEGETPRATLYLGTSAGANQVHARTADDDAVYLVDFGTFDGPASSGDWQDKTTLQIPREQIDSIVLGELTLSRVPAGGGDAAPAGQASGDAAGGSGDAAGAAAAADQADARWTLAGGAPYETVDQANADALAIQLANIRTGPVLGTERLDSYGLDEPALELGVLKTDGKRVDYTLASRGENEPYVLKSSARAEYFELRAITAEQLTEAASRAQLVDSPGEDATEASDAARPEAEPDGDSAPDARPAAPR